MRILAVLDTLTLIAHILVCFVLIGIVLIQGGKGASISASFGMGSAASAFGARTDSFMTKLTSGAAITFVITSMLLTYLGSKTGSLSQSIDVQKPKIEQSGVTAKPVTPVEPNSSPVTGGGATAGAGGANTEKTGQ